MPIPPNGLALHRSLLITAAGCLVLGGLLSLQLPDRADASQAPPTGPAVPNVPSTTSPAAQAKKTTLGELETTPPAPTHTPCPDSTTTGSVQGQAGIAPQQEPARQEPMSPTADGICAPATSTSTNTTGNARTEAR